MNNLLWAPGPPAEIFLIDCDGIRRLGRLRVHRQADTPYLDKGPAKTAAELDLDNDRYKCALLIGRVLSRMPYVHPGADSPLPGVPDSVAHRVQALWQQACRGRGCRPHANNWLLALVSK